MEARMERLRLPRLRVHLPQLTRSGLALVGAGCGLLGGLVMAVPLVLYDWAKASHAALELPAAVTAWLFGLEYFGQDDYRWWPIVIGALFLAGYWLLHGIAFAALAERVYHPLTRMGLLALGGAWSFVSFMFFWYMLLPIARDGAPFRLTAGGEFVAPNWVWILAFSVYGFATALCYGVLRRGYGHERAEQPAAPATEESRAA